MAATYEDEGPIPWFQTEVAIFYIVYFVVFPFFFVNIFVALVIVTFNELGEAELTEDIDKNQVCLLLQFMSKLRYERCLVFHHLKSLLPSSHPRRNPASSS